MWKFVREYHVFSRYSEHHVLYEFLFRNIQKKNKMCKRVLNFNDLMCVCVCVFLSRLKITFPVTFTFGISNEYLQSKTMIT